jgi:phage FluMu gp28-like protein
MSEFLHHLVANREYRQHDIELQRAMRESLINEIFSLSDDPWATEEQANG